MKLRQPKSKPSAMSLPLTGMIDVVFLLLIFFLVTHRFFKSERELTAELPGPRVESTFEILPAIVEVSWQDDQAQFRVGAHQFSEAEGLKTVLQDFPNKSQGAVVRVGDNVPYEFAVRAIGVCHESNFPNVMMLRKSP